MFELAMPWALIVLPLPWLIWFLLPRAPTQLPAALNVPFFNAMFGIVESEKRHIGKQTTLTLLFLVWSLLLFALAGPRWVGEPRPLSRDGYNIMLALDISGSMEMSDMLLQGRPATRLAVVKRAAEQFVEDRAGDRIGLILFGEVRFDLYLLRCAEVFWFVFFVSLFFLFFVKVGVGGVGGVGASTLFFLNVKAC